MNGVYSDFLLTADWNDFARAYKQKQGNRCEICGSPESLDVHHFKYDKTNLMNEDYLIVLCRNCHECMERHIKRFKAQVNVSATITKDIYINIMKRSILDFYQNSFYKPNTKATIMGFSLHDGFCSLRNILASQIQARFPDIEIMAEEGWLYYQLPTFSIEMSGVIEWRNSVIAEALDEGIKAYAIKNRFRMSDKSYYKALQSIGR